MSEYNRLLHSNKADLWFTGSFLCFSLHDFPVLLEVILLKCNQHSLFCWKCRHRFPCDRHFGRELMQMCKNWVLSVPIDWGWMQKDMKTEPDVLTSQCCSPQPSVQKTDKVSLIAVTHDRWWDTYDNLLAFCYQIILPLSVLLISVMDDNMLQKCLKNNREKIE